MERSILVVEPDKKRGKAVVHHLIQSGYDALIAETSDAALRRLYKVRPDAVIFSNRLSAMEIERLSKAITQMSNLPLVELDDGFSLILVAQYLSRTTCASHLVEALDALFDTARC